MNSEVQSQRRGKNVLLLTQLNPVNAINLISGSSDPVGLNLSVSGVRAGKNSEDERTDSESSNFYLLIKLQKIIRTRLPYKRQARDARDAVTSTFGPN